MAVCKHEEQEYIAVDPALLPSMCLDLYPDKNTSTKCKNTSQLTLHYCRRCAWTCILTKTHQQSARTHRSWLCTIAVDVSGLVSWQKHINKVQEYIAVDWLIEEGLTSHQTHYRSSQWTLHYFYRCARTCILSAAQSVNTPVYLTQAASYTALSLCSLNLFSILSTGLLQASSYAAGHSWSSSTAYNKSCLKWHCLYVFRF